MRRAHRDPLPLRASIVIALAALAGCDDEPAGPGTPMGEGTIRVVVTNSGATPDPDGYVLSISGLDDRPVSDGTFDVTEVPAGDHTLDLRGLAPNCEVDGDNPRTVTVEGDELVTTRFLVVCPFARFDAIAFQTTRTGNQEIFVMASDGSDPVNLSNHLGTDWLGVISPDGTKLLLDTERDGNREIYVVNMDGTGLENLTERRFSDEAVPDWSPDGSRIVFETGRDGNLEIYVMNADGTDQRNLTNAPGSQERYASWSPDGSRILFTTNRDGNNEIYSIRPDGTGIENLTNHPAQDFLGIASPDGSRITFTRATGFDSDVWIMDADGSGQINLTNSPGAIDELPGWSPDGSRLVFSSTRSGDFEIWTMNLDGSDPENLTDLPTAIDGAPRWGP